jgi:hypothetical protein
MRVDHWSRSEALPHPFAPAHRAAGCRYPLSILQSEFALTQVLDRPLTGRGFFEEVIRENLDVGRPDQMQLIFDRRVTRCAKLRGVEPKAYLRQAIEAALAAPGTVTLPRVA